MYITNVFHARAPMLPTAVGSRRPLLQRLMALILGVQRDAKEQSRRDAATKLYARAARYESSQPSFAADLRAAADGLERDAATAAH